MDYDDLGADPGPGSVGVTAQGEMKLFVGQVNSCYVVPLKRLKLSYKKQVPKSMDEASLLSVFEDFGAVSYLAVIRDRATKAHRGELCGRRRDPPRTQARVLYSGCAFVTYSSEEEALNVIANLHDKVKLPQVFTCWSRMCGALG